MSGRIDLQDRTGPILDILHERIEDLELLRVSGGEAVIARRSGKERLVLREHGGSLSISFQDQEFVSGNRTWVIDKIVSLL